MASALKIDKMLKGLNLEEIRAAKSDRQRELAILDEAENFAMRMQKLAGDADGKATRAGHGRTADRAHDWLAENGPATAAVVAAGIGSTRGATYQAMKKAPKRFGRRGEEWTAK